MTPINDERFELNKSPRNLIKKGRCASTYYETSNVNINYNENLSTLPKRTPEATINDIEKYRARCRFSTNIMPGHKLVEKCRFLSSFNNHNNQLSGEKIGWEYHNVPLTRVPGFGFGIAVSGGRDNPHFVNGDPSIAISDVLKSGPAEGKLHVNDRVISANGISLENVDYNTAVKVLRECGSAVNLLIKRKVLLPSSDLIKVTLTKSKRKDDFGIILGCRLYIKEVTNKSLIEKDGSLQEGDIVTKINNMSTDNLTLKDAKKLIESSKERLHLVLKREHKIFANQSTDSNNIKDNNLTEMVNGNRSNWSNQNVYVQPPTRGDYLKCTQNDEKNNLTRSQLSSPQQHFGRNRGPLAEISLTQLDQPATPLLSPNSRNNLENEEDPPPRPPPPRPNNYNEDDPIARRHQANISTEPRLISLQKKGSVGIKLTGGNDVGIYVTSVQPGTPASLQSLQPGDKILKVNQMDMKGVTREEAVLYLLSVQDQIDLIVQYCKESYDEIVANQKGDSFYIRTHFDYTSNVKGELNFHSGEVFHVIDTLFNGVVGSWLVYRMGRNGQEIQKGIIPNRSRGDELASEQQAEKSKKSDSLTSESRVSFFKRRTARRSKSLSKDHWEDSILSENGSKFPAYERVTLKHPGFIRPVVLFGPIADVARDKLLKDYPDKYSSPVIITNDNDEQSTEIGCKTSRSSGIVRLSFIKEIIEKGKHALLDITPNAVEKLNYAQFSPIVIFLRAESKAIVKEFRARYGKTGQKSSRKLFEQGVKMEKLFPHIFTSTLTVTSTDMWYKKLRETIEKQQQSNIWIGESKPTGNINDDFLFPMTSRLSYASSPESDIDLVNDSKCDGNDCSPRLLKASSDPSIATVEDTQCADAFGHLPPYSNRSKQAPLHILMNKELNKVISQNNNKLNSFFNANNNSMNNGNDDNEKSDAIDMEEYFGSSKDVYNSLQSNERYSFANGAPNGASGGIGNGLDSCNLYGSRTSTAENPEPPPRVDRYSKPDRYRTARERLFGRGDPNGASDYINTSSPPPPNVSTFMSPNQKINPIEAQNTPTNGRNGFMDNLSYSSDSYKYGTPTSTLDDRRYGSISSNPGNSNSVLNNGNSNGLPNGQNRNHDPYRFTRSTAQPVASLSPMKQDRNSKVLSPVTPLSNNYSNENVTPSRPHMPPSPPPKPSAYSVRLTDGRPVPPPKPMHYQPARPPWRQEVESNTLDQSYSQTQQLGANNIPYLSNKWPLNSSMEMSGGPPAYFPPTKDQQNSRTPVINPVNHQDMQPSYANHQSIGSPTRRIPYSDTDSSSGYMTARSNYDSRSQYSSKTSSSRSSSTMLNGNNNGPYLNLPYPPRQRDSTSNGIPQSHIDLSTNRENRGSAFELYRRPGDSIPRSTFHYHGLPPPPPPAPLIENK